MTDTYTRSQKLYPLVLYRDAAAAIEWLCSAFGFEPVMTVPADNGKIVHAELRFGDAILMLSSAPASDNGATQPGGRGVYVAVDDIDAHYRRSVGAGAAIVSEMQDTDYGSRDYAARDLEGYTWYFGTYCP